MRNYNILLLVLLIFSCKSEEEKAPALFERIPADNSGINFSNDVEEDGDFNIIEYLYYYNGGGVAVGDLNNDGLDDIYFTANQGENKLYLNKGNFQFEDITEKSGAGLKGMWSTGVTMADVNNDGLLDIYVSELGNYKNIRGHNKLFINQGDLTFTEESKKYNLDFSGFSTQAAFFDKDLDGDLDVYLLNNSVHSVHSYGRIELRNTVDTLAGDKIYENRLNEGGAFVDVTAESGIYSSPLGYGLGLAIADINLDGYPDIYVSNDFHENDYLYFNNGDGTFKENLDQHIAHTSRYSMGNDFGDLNNDGMPDLITLDMLPEDPEILMRSVAEDKQEVFDIKANYGYSDQFVRNTVQVNHNGALSDIAPLTGMHATDWSWAPLIADYNADGKNDVFITNGIFKRPNDLNYIQYLANIGRAGISDKDSLTKEMIRRMPTLKIANYMFLNDDNLNFENRTEELGLAEPTYSNGGAYADLDNDGDLDLVINNLNQEAFLYRNNTATKNFLKISLEGNTHNKKGIGARVEVFQNNKVQTRELQTTRGFQSSVPPYLYFGLGSDAQVDSVRITWSANNVQLIKDVPVNQGLQVQEKQGQRIRKDLDEEQLVDITLPYVHKENVSYEDYKYEFLMPYRLSQEGPATAVGDLDGNGTDDIFLGGARGQNPTIFYQNDGQFQKSRFSILSDSLYEDVDAVIFDANGDGKNDIYVVSGGGDASHGDRSLLDRLYINLGNNDWERRRLPNIAGNGSTVRAADYDNDGDQDLFIGTRSMPGGYGFPANQYLLLNDGSGNFRDQTSLYASGFQELGMVTDAAWVDLDNDQDQDLIIVGDWMPVTIFINEDKKLRNRTKEYGLDDLTGWWRSVKIADLNGDGNMDIIAGNFGLNNKIRPSDEKPTKLYLADFDNNGRPDPVLFYHQKGELIPLKSKDALAKQMPLVNKIFTDYNAYAQVRSINDLTEGYQSNYISIKDAQTFESGIFINTGDSLVWNPLPTKAQWSVINDAAVLKDGRLIMGGNSAANYVDIGNVDAFPGLVLIDNYSSKEADFQNLPNRFINRLLTLNLKAEEYLLVASNGDSVRLIPTKKLNLK